MAKDPAAVANKWKNNLSNAGQAIRDGVNAVNVAPGQQAAAAQSTMRARLLAAIDSGKWAQNVAAVSLQTWKNQMLNVGLARIADGANKGAPKMQSFMTQWLPFVAQAQAAISQMPNATSADRKARMIANFDMLSQFKKS